MEEKIINFACVGYGFMGKTHVGNVIKHPNANIKAIFSLLDVDLDLPEREADGGTIDVELYSDDWKDCIDHPNIDAVIIATPTQTHAEIAKYAASKGKHIFLEKPMARSVEECNEIIKAAEENNVKCFLAHILRFFQAYRTGKNLIENPISEIGKIKMIRAIRYSTVPDWSKWFFDDEKSGGCILDLSIHDIDYCCYIMGKKPVEVYCEARKLPEKNINTWAHSMTTLKFDNNEIAHTEASWLLTKGFQWYTQVELIGNEGIIQFDSKSKIPMMLYDDTSNTPLDLFEKDGYYLEMESFINSLINGEPIEVTAEDGKTAVAVCIAAIKSATEGRPVKLSEVFI